MSPARKKARLLIIDDHEILREGVRSLLAKVRPEWQICGEGTSGEDAIALTRSLDPDIVILDISMPGVSGLEACERMRKMGMKQPVLIFTTHESESLDAEVRRAGAHGYVLKSQAARYLVLAIDAILAGGSFFGGPPASDRSKDNPPSPGETRRAAGASGMISSLASARATPRHPRRSAP